MKVPETDDQFFEQYAEAFAGRYGTSPDFRERLTVWRNELDRELTSVTPGCVCIDLGCGPGFLTQHLATRCDRVVAVDRSTAMLDLARRRIDESVVTSVEFIHNSLPLPAISVERFRRSACLVVCSSVLEYVGPYRALLEQCAELLAPGGALFVSVPNRDCWYRRCERFAQKTLLRWGLFANSYLRHQRHQFTMEALMGELEGVGLVPEPFRSRYFALPFPRQCDAVLRGTRSRRSATMLLGIGRKQAHDSPST